MIDDQKAMECNTYLAIVIVPHMVIDGVGKFIDFRKYLAMAAEKGAGEATTHAEETLRQALTK